MTQQANILSFDDAKRAGMATAQGSARQKSAHRNAQAARSGKSASLRAVRRKQSLHQAEYHPREEQRGDYRRNTRADMRAQGAHRSGAYDLNGQFSAAYQQGNAFSSACADQRAGSTRGASSARGIGSTQGARSSRNETHMNGHAHGHRVSWSASVQAVPAQGQGFSHASAATRGTVPAHPAASARTSASARSASAASSRAASPARTAPSTYAAEYPTRTRSAAFAQEAAPSQTARSRSAAQQMRSDARPGIISYDDFLSEEDQETAEEGTERSAGKKTFAQKLSERKRKRAKEKAEKAFNRQFGGSSSAGTGQNGAPRAAVYKGEMGPSQRRAQRMQPAPSAARGSKASSYAAREAAGQSVRGPLAWLANAAGGVSHALTGRLLGNASAKASAKAGAAANSPYAQGVDGAARKKPSATPAGVLASALSRVGNIFFGTKARVAATSVAVFVVLAGCFMYPAAKQYYTEMRHLDQVQAEYQAVLDRNAQLAATRDYLQSDAGVEEMAHEKYGWVEEGENSVLVYGLPDDGTMADTNLYVQRGSVPAPETWYSVILDPFFGVE